VVRSRIWLIGWNMGADHVQSLACLSAEAVLGFRHSG
jgi:hypothetical protein